MSSSKFGTKIRKELHDDYRVFYVTAHGYAADHYFGWLPKALNTHREIFALLAHEGSRPKYTKERLRSERPDLIAYTEFLNDMGMTFASIGDCYSYRAGQFPYLWKQPQYKNIPVLNLVRHPFVWLQFYMLWRSGNMRMRLGSSNPVAWEYKVAQHALFRSLNLKEYDQEDIAVWSTFQGMYLLNNMIADKGIVEHSLPIERIVKNPDVFKKVVQYLTKGKVEYLQDDIDRAFAMVPTLFPGEAPVESNPRNLFESWPGWKVDAFRKIVRPETAKLWKSYGYNLYGIEKTVSGPPQNIKLSRPIFIASLMKSGTWLVREIVSSLTGLELYEPQIQEGTPDYGDHNLIEFHQGTFFSWHSVMSKNVVALLQASNAAPIFVMRNIYDLLLSMYNHLSKDVDQGIGRSVGDPEHFKNRSLDENLSLMISGFYRFEMAWEGLKPHLLQMQSMLDFAKENNCLILPYSWIVHHKEKVIKTLASFVGSPLPPAKLRRIIHQTSIESMKKKLSDNPEHFREATERLSRDVFKPFHIDMINGIIHRETPTLNDDLQKSNLQWLIQK